jgi:hypothetical protein
MSTKITASFAKGVRMALSTCAQYGVTATNTNYKHFNIN